MAIRTLVVDDTKLIRDVFAQQLVACGFESQACVSLEETLRIIRDWQPDVVLLDLRMPGHDGFEVIEQILLQFPTPPKVIAVSGAVSGSVRQQTEDAGFSAFLQKPFRLPQILAVVEEVLNRS